jgi:uncharacterized protein (DUF488 family)
VKKGNRSKIHHQTPENVTTVYTVGHSTRTIPEFVDLLQAGQIELVVDIRRVPRSRTNPHYNLEVLPKELEPYNIGHTRIDELGGLRKKSEVACTVNGFWTNRSFHNYADYALSEPFHKGLTHLLTLSETSRVAIMCAEAVWWRCHRRIVADYLINAGCTVYHLMNTNSVIPAKMTNGAVPFDNGLHYPSLACVGATKPET